MLLLRRLGGAEISAAATLVLLLVSSHLRSTHQNNYVRVAYAWLHGRMWIDWPGRWMDAVLYNGREYGVDGPTPAIFEIPFVLVRGMDANQTTLAIIITVIAVWLAWKLATALGVRSRSTKAWLMVFFVAGTDVWWCAQLGDVWFLAHLTALMFMVAALLELCTRCRGWVVATCFVLAAGARFPEVATLPVLVWALWTGAFANMPPAPRERIRRLRGFAIPCIAGAFAFMGYDELMWGTLWDIGHTVYYHQDSYGSPTGSPFQLGYVPYQLYSYFLRGPILVEWLQKAQWPYIKPDVNGLALTYTSPALILTSLARSPRRGVVALWIATVLVAAPSFLYYLNGWWQFGMRHMLDFLPYLFALMAIGVRDRMPRWGIALIVWSALVGAWGVWYWNMVYRTGT
jgi:hypothetical protein